MNNRPRRPGRPSYQNIEGRADSANVYHDKNTLGMNAPAPNPNKGHHPGVANNITEKSRLVDADAIAAALQMCSSELDAMEMGATPPESLDDLVIVDMYTPKEQIPAAKRHQPLKFVPAEELSARDKQQKPVRENAPLNIQNKVNVQNRVNIQNRVEHNQNPTPNPGVNPPPQAPVQKQAEDSSFNPDDILMEVPPQLLDKEQQPKTNLEKIIPEPKLTDSPDPLNSGLMAGLVGNKKPTVFSEQILPNENAYKIDRTDFDGDDPDQRMSLKELRLQYEAQRGRQEKSTTTEDPSEHLQAIYQHETNDGPAEDLSRFDKPEKTISSGVGFLQGLASGGNDQSGAFSSRSQQFETPVNETSNGFLQGLTTEPAKAPETPSFPPQPGPVESNSLLSENLPFNQPDNLQYGAQRPPGFSDLWNSDTVSPVAKAYRDTHLGIKQDRVIPNPPPAMQPKPQPRDVPGFLERAALESKKFNQPVEPPKPKHQNRTVRRDRIDNSRQRKSMRAYFGLRPKWSVFVAFAGLASMLSQYRFDPLLQWFKADYNLYYFGGLIVLVLAILLRYFRIPKPEEQKLDDWIADDMDILEKSARELLELNRRELLLEPIILQVLPDLDAGNLGVLKGVYGKDHILRCTPRAITVICFTVDQILIYEGAMDLTTGQRAYEQVNEFFYRDVVTTRTVQMKVQRAFFSSYTLKNLLLPWRWYFVERIIRSFAGRRMDNEAAKIKEFFEINLNDGSKIELILRDGRILSERAYEEIPTSTDDKVIRAIRDFIAARKNEQLVTIR